jgi:hypothetical protein
MSLPIYQTNVRELSMMQTQWSSQLNPVLTTEIINGHLIPNVSLASGDNVINHLLGRNLIGWFTVGVNAAVTLYDKQATNNMSNLTLILHSSATCIVSLWVF